MKSAETTESGVKKFNVSLDKDIFDFLVAESQAHHGNNRSAAIKAALLELRDKGIGPFGAENALIGGVKNVLRSLGIESVHDDKGVDWILPALEIGIEVKTRFSPGAAQERMIAAIAYSVGRGRCSEVVIVGPEAMSAEDADKFKAAAASFRYCKASFVRVDELQVLLARRKAEKGIK